MEKAYWTCELLNNYAIALRNLRAYTECEKMLLEAIDLNKNFPNSYINLSNCYMSQNRYREAINEKPIILWIEIAQKQNRSVQDQFLSIGLTETISQFTKSNFSLLGITNSF